MSGAAPSAATQVLRHNEQVKFLAAMLDKLALAIVGAGYIAPVIAGTLPGNVQSAVTIWWVILGIGLWLVGYLNLGRLL